MKNYLQNSVKSNQQNNQKPQEQQLVNQQNSLKVSCFYKIQSSAFCLDKRKLDTSNQMLFSDLQLMLINGHIDPKFWNSQIESQIEAMIKETKFIKDPNKLKLKDFYFSDINRNRFERLDKNGSAKENHDIFRELKEFGQKIMEKNQGVQQDQYDLRQLLDQAILVFRKIQLHCQYSEHQFCEDIQKRYVIDLILMQPQSETNTLQLTCLNEQQVQLLLKKYLELLKGLQIDEFILEFIFQNQFEDVKNSFNFFQDFSQFQRKEQIKVFLEDKQKFKREAIEYMNQQLLKNGTQGQANILEAIQQAKEDQYFLIKNPQFSSSFFTQLENMKQKIINVAKDLKTTAFLGLEDLIENTLIAVCQDSSIWTENLEFTNLKLEIFRVEISKQIALRIEKDLQFIPDIEQFQKGRIMYDFVEKNLVYSIIDSFKKQFLEFFSTFQVCLTNSKQNYNLQNTYFNNISKQIYQGKISIFQGIIDLFHEFRKLYEENCTLDSQSFQQDSILKYPKSVQIYFLSQQDNYQKKIDTTKFEPHLAYFINELHQLILKQKLEFQDPEINDEIHTLWDQNLKQIQLELLQHFIPFVNMEKYMASDYFKNLVKNKIENLKEKVKMAVNQYKFYRLYVDSQLCTFQNYQKIQVKKQTIDDFRETQLNSLKQDLLKDFSNFNSQNLNELFPQQKKKEIDTIISNFLQEIIPLQLQNQFEDYEQNNQEEYEKFSKEFDYYFLPFQCISETVKEYFLQKKKSERSEFINQLRQYCSNTNALIEKYIIKIKQYYDLGLTEKSLENQKTNIKNYLKAKYKNYNINVHNENYLAKEIIQEMRNFCQYSEENLQQQILAKQRGHFDSFLNEILEITKQQCQQILIPIIKIEKVELQEFEDQIENFRLNSNPLTLQQLANESFIFFKNQILNSVLSKYEVQIVKQIQEQVKIS